MAGRPSGRRYRSALPQFAADAANRQIARVSTILSDAADSLEELAGESSALPANVSWFASAASGRLRDLAERTEAQDAGKLVDSLQRSTARHPFATAGIGAAIGAIGGLALVRLGRAATDVA
jgi:ElaB/YqjD/DUF883 family membrane-anchored ribosome-binding protein